MSLHTTIPEDVVLSTADTFTALSQAVRVIHYIATTACLDPQIAQLLAEKWLRENASVLRA